MCTVSMVGEHYSDKWKALIKQGGGGGGSGIPEGGWGGPSVGPPWVVPPTKAEFEALKKEVEEMKKLLLRAKAYDEKHKEPHCEMEEKVALLKKIAELVGIDLSEVFGK